MSAATLTFSPAMFHAAIVKRTKTVTRRHNSAELTRAQVANLITNGTKTAAVLPNGITVDIGKPAHLPGEVKPAATSWAVHSDWDDQKPSDIEPDNTGGIWFNDGTRKPRWAGKTRPARFFPGQIYALAPQIRILDARPEWLHDITQADVLNEGLTQITKDEGRTWKYGLADRDGFPGTDDFGWPWSLWSTDPREAYFRLWDTLHGPGHAFTNPLVWRYHFEPL